MSYFSHNVHSLTNSTIINKSCRFRHKNLVELMGYCLNPAALVLEFMEEGNLDSHLHKVYIEGIYLRGWIKAADRAVSYTCIHMPCVAQISYLLCAWFLHSKGEALTLLQNT